MNVYVYFVHMNAELHLKHIIYLTFEIFFLIQFGKKYI